jgi:hypothetical protein
MVSSRHPARPASSRLSRRNGVSNFRILSVMGCALAVLTMASALAAQGIERRGGSCPSGYNQSGNYCVPGSGANPAIHRVGGSCPSGYNQSGDYCVGASSSAKHAIIRSGGSCPSGYSQSSGYCLKN